MDFTISTEDMEHLKNMEEIKDYGEVNFYGETESNLYQVQAELIYFNLQVVFLEQPNCNTVLQLKFVDTENSVVGYEINLSDKTTIYKIKRLYPRSLKWKNDSSNDIRFDFLTSSTWPELEAIISKNFDYIPFSDGNGGTVFLFFLRKKLAYLAHYPEWDSHCAN